MRGAAADPSIHVHLGAFPELARCVFDGEAGAEPSDLGPWLAAPARRGDLWDWFLDEGWGRGWGVIARTALPLPRLKRHLEKFLRVERAGGGAMFFEFYRPEHLRTYLPVFEDDRRRAFMREIDGWIAEDGTGAGAVRMTLEPGGRALSAARLPLG